jgi:hypothetical protein
MCAALGNPFCTADGGYPGGITACNGFDFIGGIRDLNWLLFNPIQFGYQTLVQQLTVAQGTTAYPGYNIPYPGTQYPGSPIAWAARPFYGKSLSYYGVRSDGYAFLIKQQWRICPPGSNLFPPPGPSAYCVQTQHFACPPPGLGASVINEISRVPIVCATCVVGPPAASFGPAYGPFQPNGELAFAVYGTLINVLPPPC